MAPACDTCRTPLDAPDSGPPRIGRVVTVGNRLLVRHAVAVEQHDDAVLVLDRNDTPTPVETDRFDGLARVPLAPDDVISAAGRLWVAERARVDGALKARWSDTAVHAAAVRSATASVGARRGAALDLVTLGLPDEPDLRLSASELTWYRARAAARHGDAHTLVHLLGQLPPSGYPGRIDLLLIRAVDLFADAALAERADALLKPFATASLDARALRAALRSSAPRGTLNLLHAYARVAAGDDPQVAATTLAIAGGGPLPSGARSSGPAVRALDTHLSRLSAARDDPDGLDEAALRAVGLVAELARRAYLSGDERRLADLPDADEAVRHYRALHAYRSTGRVDAEHLRPHTRATVTHTAELAQPFAGRRVAPAEVAADPSTWSFLVTNAVDEKITLTDRLRAEHPQFALWLALCATRNSLRDGRWSEVAAAGQRIADQTATPALRAEALNVAAYAHWQIGAADEALAVLDRALAIHPVPAHAVNAALIAAERGGRAALPYLARVRELTTRPGVRRGALEHAIGLWRATDGTGYPSTLASMVRSELSAPQDDTDFHRTLLELSLAHDRVWLRGADTGIGARGRVQTRTARYYVARAAYAEDPSADTLRGAAMALTALCRLDPPPVWTAAEQARLVDELDLALQAPEPALNPAPAIAVLLAADALGLRAHLTFAIRAGARLAEAARKRGRMVSVDAERRLILAPVRLYERRHEELDRDERTAVADVLATHLRLATTAIVNVAVTRNNTLVAHWRRLEREPVPDHATGRRIAARKVEILDRLDRYLDRCRPYVEALATLPVDEKFQQQIGDVLARLTTMSTRARESLHEEE
jgi:hypothetical protein